MPLTTLSTLDHPQLAPYRQLKHSNLTRWTGQFIAEGRLVVERLLLSRFQTDSVLISDRRLSLLDELAIPAETPVFVVAEELARELTGFNFHAGVLACGLRGTPLTSRQLAIARSPETAASGGSELLIACPRMTDPDNLGGLIRLARAFGAAGVLLGDACCDPFSRRTLRVSMGNAFELPIVESTDLSGDLQYLKAEAGYQLSATVLDATATPLHKARALRREILLLGNEAHGLDPEWVELADRRLTIPMQGGTDSLNVTVAAGICLHWLRQAAVAAAD
jgi:tRNA G18 (ribose-2'-O)-methylase SpoU